MGEGQGEGPLSEKQQWETAAQHRVTHLSGMKLKGLAAKSALESYGAVATAIKRYGSKLARDAGEAARMNKMMQTLNVKI